MDPLFSLIGNLTGKAGGFLGDTLNRLIPSQTFNYDWSAERQRPVALPAVQPALAKQMTGSSLPSANEFKYIMGKKDYQFTRPQLQRLFKEKDSPLSPQLDEFIKAGEKHGIDPRILASVAQVESSLGKQYPETSFNPFGYIWLEGGKHPENYEEIVRGLYGAGFESLPHAIDALTGRFNRQPTEGYKKFYQDPTFSNLQQAYNANERERENYLKVLAELQQYFE